METPLYDYPDSYEGRKTFVYAYGHDKSVPKYKTYMGVDGKRHVLQQYGGSNSMMGEIGSYILPDKLEYVSPMDGTTISSRSTHREHMIRHGVVEAGDVKMGESQRTDNAPMQRAGHDIVRAIQELGSR